VNLALSLERAETIPGWMDRDELAWLAEQAAQATKIVEVGSWCGRSTRALADHTAGTVWVADPWTGTQESRIAQTQHGDVLIMGKPVKRPVLAAFVENLSDHLATGRVQVLPTRSMIAIEVLRHLAPFDLVFLDGDHAYKSVAQEIAAFRPLVRAGGVLAGHDYGNARWPDVTRAVDDLVPERQVLNRIWWTRV
jgi:predicted O-methyltransferase YrrM